MLKKKRYVNLGSAIGDILRGKWECLLVHAVSHGQPMAVIDGSDGWGRTVTETTKIAFEDAFIFWKGRVLCEFLFDRKLSKTIDDDGRICMAMDITLPRPMIGDKGCWNILQAACDTVPVTGAKPRTISV